MNKKMTPIFVLGSNRNGTTWLTNIISNHPSIASLSDISHWGAKENYMCNNQMYFDEYKDIESYIKFIEIYSSGDIFDMSSVKKKYFYENICEDFIDIFLSLMDQHAKQNEKSKWVTKMDSDYLHNRDLLKHLVARLKERYNDVKIVSVRRDKQSVVKSSINLKYKRAKTWNELFTLHSVIKKTVKQKIHYNTINELNNRIHVCRLSFDSLKNNRKSVAMKLSRYLGLNGSTHFVNDRYQPNSSYGTSSESISIDGVYDGIIVAVTLLCEYIENMVLLLVKLRRATKKIEPKVSWRRLKMDYMPSLLSDELHNEGRHALREILLKSDILNGE